MAYNVLDVIRDEVLGKTKHVCKVDYKSRLETCNKCENLVMKFPISGGNCKLCGCFVKTKAKYKRSQCPDKPPKWVSIP